MTYDQQLIVLLLLLLLLLLCIASECHCCPKIIKNDSKIIDNNDDTHSVIVSMATTIGNCTAREEFRYVCCILIMLYFNYVTIVII